jgi:hypothetical protein
MTTYLKAELRRSFSAPTLDRLRRGDFVQVVTNHKRVWFKVQAVVNSVATCIALNSPDLLEVPFDAILNVIQQDAER